MEILTLLITLSVVLVIAIGAFFYWSVHSGQFDDLEGPAYRVLADDDKPAEGDLRMNAGLTEINREKDGAQ